MQIRTPCESKRDHISLYLDTGKPLPDLPQLASPFKDCGSSELEKSLDPATEMRATETTKATILYLQEQLQQEQERSAARQHQLEEQICYLQLLLGPTRLPDHLQFENLDDSLSKIESGTVFEDRQSPEVNTLVEPDEVIFSEGQSMMRNYYDSDAMSFTESFRTSELQSQRHDHGRDNDGWNTVQWNHDNSTTKHRPPKKRKRHSDFPKQEISQKEEAITSQPNSEREDGSTVNRNEIIIRTSVKLHVNQSSRPGSWPRTGTRLVRKSACVSIRKLTDAFERLKTQQDTS